MTNVEGICRRFVEEKREKIGKLMEDSLRWPRCAFLFKFVRMITLEQFVLKQIPFVLTSYFGFIHAFFWFVVQLLQEPYRTKVG